MDYYFNTKRPHHIKVNLNDEEYDNLKAIIEYTGIRREAVLREMIAGLKIQENPKADYPGIIRELNRIGNNVNQIAATINTYGFVDEPKLRAVVEDLHKMEKVFNDVFAPAESEVKA